MTHMVAFLVHGKSARENYFSLLNSLMRRDMMDRILFIDSGQRVATTYRNFRRATQ